MENNSDICGIVSSIVLDCFLVHHKNKNFGAYTQILDTIAIPLLFVEGEKRRNKYGPDPKRGTLKLMKQQSVTLTKDEGCYT